LRLICVAGINLEKTKDAPISVSRGEANDVLDN
jgi:hypothetical protein